MDALHRYHRVSFRGGLGAAGEDEGHLTPVERPCRLVRGVRRQPDTADQSRISDVAGDTEDDAVQQAWVVHRNQLCGLAAAGHAQDVDPVRIHAGLGAQPAQRVGEVLQRDLDQVLRQPRRVEVGDAQGAVTRSGEAVPERSRGDSSFGPTERKDRCTGRRGVRRLVVHAVETLVRQRLRAGADNSAELAVEGRTPHGVAVGRGAAEVARLPPRSRVGTRLGDGGFRREGLNEAHRVHARVGAAE